MKINENEQLLLGIRGGVGGVPPPSNCWQNLLLGIRGGNPPRPIAGRCCCGGPGGGYPLSIRSYRGNTITQKSVLPQRQTKLRPERRGRRVGLKNLRQHAVALLEVHIGVVPRTIHINKAV